MENGLRPTKDHSVYSLRHSFKDRLIAAEARTASSIKYSEEVSEEENREDPYEELIDVFYVAEEFLCPSCNLHLDSRETIEAVGLELDHVETDTRQREYEPDYGND